MLYQNSSFSAVYGQDDYELEEDNERFLDDEGDIVEQGESDEDTEEASETDMRKSEEYTEIKEQVYQDKLASLKKQLQQLKDGNHPECNRKLKRIEALYNESQGKLSSTSYTWSNLIESDNMESAYIEARSGQNREIDLELTTVEGSGGDKIALTRPIKRQ